MRGIVIFTAFLFCGAGLAAQNDSAFRGHDPKKDANLNPYINREINPDSNLSINPSANWNMNPLKEQFGEPHAEFVHQSDDQPPAQSAVE